MLIALLVCLIPTTIGALLSAIGIAGMDRLVQHNVLAIVGPCAVEAAGDVTTLLLDKTGTITYGNRRASEFVPLSGIAGDDLIRAAALSSMADPTPEGTSIVELASSMLGKADEAPRGATSVPFSAHTRMPGVDLPDGTQIRKGAGSAVLNWLGDDRVSEAIRTDLDARTHVIAQSGGTPLVVATRTAHGDARILGIVHLKDIVKEGLTQRFADLRAMGIRTVMITGDNPLTAAAPLARQVSTISWPNPPRSRNWPTSAASRPAATWSR